MPFRQDDPTIDDGALLWRCVHPDWIREQPDGSWRAGSNTFLDDLSGEVSYYIADETSVDALRVSFPGWSIAQIDAGFVRSLGYLVARDPDGGGPGHVVVCPKPEENKSGKRKIKDARRIADQARWIVLDKEQG